MAARATGGFAASLLEHSFSREGAKFARVSRGSILYQPRLLDEVAQMNGDAWGRFDPFATPRGNGRCLRIPVVDRVVLARLNHSRRAETRNALNDHRHMCAFGMAGNNIRPFFMASPPAGPVPMSICNPIVLTGLNPNQNDLKPNQRLEAKPDQLEARPDQLEAELDGLKPNPGLKPNQTA
jgi:hypothetical protein